MKDALQIIITKSPYAMKQALGTLRAISVGSPMVQNRYNHTVEAALSDQQADFTVDERAIIASYLDVAESERTRGEGNRDKLIQIRVTANEQQYITQAAEDAGMNISDWTRGLWGLE